MEAFIIHSKLDKVYNFLHKAKRKKEQVAHKDGNRKTRRAAKQR